MPAPAVGWIWWPGGSAAPIRSATGGPRKAGAGHGLIIRGAGLNVGQLLRPL